ncbi:MAG: hypothetical protein JOZ47_11730 [Kutzneria sp.]|nr:hypothetical protein [Kutzneria sp.]MBV9845730.1 hypothetical protein [Kutzneria sp.]
MSDRVLADGLSDRLHDFLLRMAGRIDDDAVNSARELIAVAELDRAAELLVGCLAAGGVPVTPDEHRYLRSLLDETRSDPSLADRLKVRDTWYAPPHRFSSERDACVGVEEALRPAMGFLRDVRSVQCVWRLTPAGATPGVVPQRVVIVEIGSEGFAPATAYRVAQALAVAGLRAVVEVLRPGVEPTDYHLMAAAAAKPVIFADGRGRQPGPATADAARPAVAPGPPDHESPTVIVSPAAMPPMIDPPAERHGSGEDQLSDVERDLLRQLHEELAQREERSNSESSG